MKKTGRHHIVPVLSKGGNGQSSQHYTIIDVTLFLRPEPRFISAGYPELPVLFLKSSHVALGMIISVKRMNSKISVIFPYFSCSGRSIIQAREKALACCQHHVRLPGTGSYVWLYRKNQVPVPGGPRSTYQTRTGFVIRSTVRGSLKVPGTRGSTRYLVAPISRLYMSMNIPVCKFAWG